ncbi:hypothetical protein [Salibacter halophilus]|uniref:Uncharacterized protein n=1 Tax=Salibacter halophilus TaxID=1803916 RepID=A0A6N6M9Q8_9FLAO|nr:hypothetical protein [Salibacter halophilus]KAB1064896.1 hypothetical protein F3059_05960 [Salibacter halophilus]
MKKKNIITAVLLLSFIIIGCSEKKHKIKNPEYTLAIVIDIKKEHWGRGFYKPHVFYKFEVNGIYYEGDFESDQMERSYTSKYSVGDSLLIKFNKKKPMENLFIKRTYAKPRYDD